MRPGKDDEKKDPRFLFLGSGSRGKRLPALRVLHETEIPNMEG
jgi:hypothetical protein